MAYFVEYRANIFILGFRKNTYESYYVVVKPSEYSLHPIIASHFDVKSAYYILKNSVVAIFRVLNNQRGFQYLIEFCAQKFFYF